jgi:hypothetical protein
MDIFQTIFRSTIQSIVIGVWGLVLLMLVVGSLGRLIGFVWRCFHPARAMVLIRDNDEVVDAEWVREL